MARAPGPQGTPGGVGTVLPAKLGFLPDPALGLPDESWWRLTPWALARMVRVLGFDVAGITFHRQLYPGAPCPMFTLVGRRRKGTRKPGV